MQLRKTTAVAISALALVPATAMAATITGGPGNERLRGTSGPDFIDGNAGKDRLFGFGAADRLTGGPGNDRVFGGTGDDVVFGVQGDDRLHGGPGDDTQEGGAGNDRIFANAGIDVSRGGDGDDVLWALARVDVQPGTPGAVDQVGDTLEGGNGADRFRTRDGEVDRITCGDGTDRAHLDHVDVITDATAATPNGSCETVNRKGWSAQASRGENRRRATTNEKTTA